MEKEKRNPDKLHDEERLVDMLRKYAASEAYPFHMPGHKRIDPGEELKDFAPAFQLDITEIDGFDELYHPQGILKKARDNAAAYYGTKATFFCVNGSTGALHTAIASVWNGKDPLLIARNCHKAVYNGISLLGQGDTKLRYLVPEYLENYGIWGAILPEDVEKALSQGPVGAVILTSPTYDGVISDIKAIAEITHRYKVPLIVDEAHGAYFGVQKELPQSAANLGADLVVQSLHKTLPALTQTALLHVNSDRINEDTVAKKLEMLQTSSPSYLLMANMDACIRLLQTRGEALGKYLIACHRKILEAGKNLHHIRIAQEADKGHAYGMEPGKILLSVKGTDRDGTWLYRQLVDRYALQPEMASHSYALLMLTVMDREEGIKRLISALQELDRECGEMTGEKKDLFVHSEEAEDLPLQWCGMKTAQEREAEIIPLDKACGHIAARFVYLYPPGAPILVPGEKISEREIGLLQQSLSMGLHVQGLEQENTGIAVLVQEEEELPKAQGFAGI
ncbi:MAG: aminotransferase class I/II-fold pyridoxal phosphate-dependent enzyme [Lachnospiraceae bacterium]|nr:aminotransferase class I/II-fold pyridoxal phosphate-dependent enzyme [Lachnospiraceae bacterium]